MKTKLAWDDIRKDIKRFMKNKNSKQVISHDLQIFIRELKNGKANVEIYLTALFQYENEHRIYAKARKSLKKRIFNDLHLKEACQKANLVKKEIIENTKEKPTIKFLEFEKIEWF
jgi:hypothetical protein